MVSAAVVVVLSLFHWPGWCRRLVLNDQWNMAGLTGGLGGGSPGLPLCTSHYGFIMVGWHLPLALLRQHYSAARRVLTFDPVASLMVAPKQWPIFLPGSLASLQITTSPS